MLGNQNSVVKNSVVKQVLKYARNLNFGMFIPAYALNTSIATLERFLHFQYKFLYSDSRVYKICFGTLQTHDI